MRERKKEKSCIKNVFLPENLNHVVVVAAAVVAVAVVFSKSETKEMENVFFYLLCIVET